MPINRLFFENARSRPCDDKRDIIEAEYGHNELDELTGFEPKIDSIREGWDESQAIEILAAERGWLHGERFYDPIIKPGEGLELDDFQYCALNPPPTVEWRSIDEDSPKG